MNDIDLVDLTVRLTDGTTVTYRGVYTVIRPEALHVFTIDYLDPAHWRTESGDPVQVISYTYTGMLSWVERDAPNATPYVILPDTDLGGRPLGDVPQPDEELHHRFVDAAVRRGIDLPLRGDQQ